MPPAVLVGPVGHVRARCRHAVHPHCVRVGLLPPLTIELTLHGEQYDVAAIGPDWLTLRHPRPAPPGLAFVRVIIDGQPIVYLIELFDGIDPARQKQTFRHLGVVDDVAA